jgi:hypothetical protein
MAFQALAVIGATSASAAFATCTFSGGAITITLAVDNVVAIDEGAAQEITIDGANTTTACLSATNATLTNTTSINVTGNTGDEEVDINLDVEWGTINWTLNLLSGTADEVSLDGSTVAAATAIDVVAGVTGIDLNNDGDLDATVSGVETLSVTGSAGDDSISGAGSTATGAVTTMNIDATGGLGDDTFVSGGGNDTFDGGAGEDVADYSAATAALNGNLVSNIVSGMGVDSIPNVEDLVGGPQGDTLTGVGPEDNVITGGGGDDIIDCGGDATDEDTVDFSDSATAVTVDLGAGTATGNGADKISNCEDVQGSDLNDTLTGDDNDNALFGGGGNDLLKGGDGGDDGADTLDGEGGIDWVDYSDRTKAVTVDLTVDPTTPGPCNDGVIEFNDGQAAEGDCVNTENANLGTGDDTFTGNAFSNTVQPGGGQNVLDGNAGGDTLDYSVGYTSGVTINMAGGGVSQDAVEEFENAIGTAFADNITGNEVSNTIKGGGGNDNLRGGSGDDTLRAGKGNDNVRGGSGDDDMFGGKGKKDRGFGGSGTDLCKGFEFRKGCELK